MTGKTAAPRGSMRNPSSPTRSSARELSQRLAERGIAVNSLHPGSNLGTGFLRNAAAPIRLLLRLARPLGKTLPQGAAPQTLLAASPLVASPLVAGVTGLYWSDCKPAK